MSIRMKSSKSLFTIFLAGSLCGLPNSIQANQNESLDNQVEFTVNQNAEEPEHRLQITGATNLILAAIAAQTLVIQGHNVVIAQQVSLNQVGVAATNVAILTAVTTSPTTTGIAFNSAMNTVFTDLTTALTAPITHANILALQTAVTAAQTAANALTGLVTPTYSQVEILAGLQQLQVAVTTWLAAYPV